MTFAWPCLLPNKQCVVSFFITVYRVEVSSPYLRATFALNKQLTISFTNQNRTLRQNIMVTCYWHISFLSLQFTKRLSYRCVIGNFH
jgi:hypothetical protein